MLITNPKPKQEILEFIKEEENIFILVCGGCPEACESASDKKVKEIEKEIKEAKKNITLTLKIDFLCNKALLTTKLINYIEKIKNSDSLLVLSCGIGVQALSKLIDKPLHPGLNTIYLGGFQGLWPSEERCQACGDCLLEFTEGICPVTSCSKSLLNGPCGGTKDGKCEVDNSRDCGWQLIYEKLKKTRRLKILEKLIPARNHQNMLPSPETLQLPSSDIEK